MLKIAVHSHAKRRQTQGRAFRLALAHLLLIFVGASAPFSIARGVVSFPGQATRLQLTEPLRVKWQYPTPRTLNLPPAIFRESIYLPLADGVLVALAANTGNLRWRAEVGGEISATPVADESGAYVATAVPVAERKPHAAAGAIRALSRQSGVTLWMRTLYRPLTEALAQTPEILYAASEDGRVYAFRKSDGAKLWETNLSDKAFTACPAINGAAVYFGNEDGTLYAVNKVKGTPLWRYRTRGAIRGPIVVVEEVVYFGSADGKVYAVREKDGKQLWSKRTGAAVQSIVGDAAGLLVASLDNFVYYLTPRQGSLLWKRQLAGRITSQPLVRDKSAVLTPLGGDSAVVLNLENGKQLNAIALAEDDATGSSPVLAGDLLLLTTRRGLVAYG